MLWFTSKTCREFKLDEKKVCTANLDEGSSYESHASGSARSSEKGKRAGSYEKVGLEALLAVSGQISDMSVGYMPTR